jgi:hypothetical protein
MCVWEEDQPFEDWVSGNVIRLTNEVRSVTGRNTKSGINLLDTSYLSDEPPKMAAPAFIMPVWRLLPADSVEGIFHVRHLGNFRRS